jgi:hypothetical protein
MHLYLNYAREHWALPGENPPVGLILCAERDHAVAKYALDGLSNKVLAAEYRMTLPQERLLAEEIERTRRQLDTQREGVPQARRGAPSARGAWDILKLRSRTAGLEASSELCWLARSWPNWISVRPTRFAALGRGLLLRGQVSASSIFLAPGASTGLCFLP